MAIVWTWILSYAPCRRPPSPLMCHTFSFHLFVWWIERVCAQCGCIASTATYWCAHIQMTYERKSLLYSIFILQKFFFAFFTCAGYFIIAMPYFCFVCKFMHKISAFAVSCAHSNRSQQANEEPNKSQGPNCSTGDIESMTAMQQ